MTQTKHTRRERVAQILQAALAIAPAVGYNRMTRDQIAAHCGIPSSLIAYHMGTMCDLRRAVMREAVRVECLAVVAQGLVMGDRHAKRASDDLRARAMGSVMR